MCIQTSAPLLTSSSTAQVHKAHVGPKDLSMLDLVRTEAYLENMKRYAQVLCIGASADGLCNKEQADWIKTYLSAQRFFPSVLESVDDMVVEATLVPACIAATCAINLILGSDLKGARSILVHDMYRVAAINNFPEPQVEMVAMIAEGIGMGVDSHIALRRRAEIEQLLVRERVVQHSRTSK